MRRGRERGSNILHSSQLLILIAIRTHRVTHIYSSTCMCTNYYYALLVMYYYYRHMYKIVYIHVYIALYISNVVAVYRVYLRINGNMILLLSLLHVAAIVTVGQGSCPQDCFGGLSPYEQYCCNASNYGEIVRLTEENRHHFILCPTNRPTQCVPTSCSDVARNGGAISGYYDITLTNGSTASVYCNMEGCDGEGGWTRVAYLNMSDPSQQCPTELRLYTEGGVRACGRWTSSGCDSVTFSTNGISYSQVCGRVIGYQYGHTDAIDSTLTIDSYYVDGISITRGSPRQHIWTLAAAYHETGISGGRCPCNNGSTAIVPSFVGDDYFCESGTLTYNGVILYTDDPLWDGEGCGGVEGLCCNAPGIPWFHKVLNSSTTDDIELRMCSNHYIYIEDTPVGLYELYIK